MWESIDLFNATEGIIIRGRSRFRLRTPQYLLKAPNGGDVHEIT